MNKHSRTSPLWWYIVVSLPSASEFFQEEIGHFLIEMGAGGTIQIGNQQLGTYFQGTEPEKNQFIETISQRVSVQSVLEVEEENWTARCEELWSPVSIGSLRIIPVLEEENSRMTASEGELFLLPGTGFGTGHHGTTAGVMELLQKKQLFPKTPASLLDVGTGSAILSLASHLLFPEASIDACDICPQAIQNASVNIRMNAAESFIELREASIDSYSDSYDLILANIFPEVLVTLHDDFLKRLQTSGTLILSGIMKEKRSLIYQHFDATHDWNMIDELCIDSWYSIAYTKAA